MYQIIGITRLLKWYAALTAALAVALVLAFPPTKWGDLWSPISTAGVVTAAILLVLGQSKVFPLLCRWSPLGRIFPPLEGMWSGVALSNWPMVEGRPRDDHTEPLLEIPVSMRVKARLLDIKLELSSEERYSASQSVAVRIQRDQEHGTVHLTYVYRSKTKTPRTTDEQSHLGAACLEMATEDRSIELHGVYWTNRSWQRGQNTAGTIKLTRAT